MTDEPAPIPIKEWPRVNVRLSPARLERLQRIAAEEDRSLSNLLTRIVTEWLEWREHRAVSGYRVNEPEP